MKASEFRKLIREEVRKVINESTQSTLMYENSSRMDMAALKKIQSSKPGDIVTVNTDWSPRGIKKVKVKILEPFKKRRGTDDFTALVDYKGKLEKVTINYEDEEAFIGGNWDSGYSRGYLDSIAKQHNLKFN